MSRISAAPVATRRPCYKCDRRYAAIAAARFPLTVYSTMVLYMICLWAFLSHSCEQEPSLELQGLDALGFVFGSEADSGSQYSRKTKKQNYVCRTARIGSCLFWPS